MLSGVERARRTAKKCYSAFCFFILWKSGACARQALRGAGCKLGGCWLIGLALSSPGLALDCSFSLPAAKRLSSTMRCSEPGGNVAVAIHASRGPGR